MLSSGLMSFRKQEPGSRTKSGENSYEYGSDFCKRNNLRTKQRENDFESDSEGSDQSYKLKLHQQKTFNLMQSLQSIEKDAEGKTLPETTNKNSHDLNQ